MARLKQTVETFEARQWHILSAAAAHASEFGINAMHIKDVAKAACVADGTIYLYFKNIEDLRKQTFDYLYPEGAKITSADFRLHLGI